MMYVMYSMYAYVCCTMYEYMYVCMMSDCDINFMFIRTNNV